MYRVLIADDEGIMREALDKIIKSSFGNECELVFAKTGRAVVELAETFRPDIAFVDIQMPGINGIQAMKEIQKFSRNIRFIIISAYDKFDYAKEAINLGVLDYLTKPIKRSTVVDVMNRAIEEINHERKKRSDNLKIREKLETVIPIVENGFVNSLLTQDEGAIDFSYYRMLLDIEEKYAYTILIQFGQESGSGVLTAPVGMSMNAQKMYPRLSSVCKEFFSCIVGPVLTNRMILVVRCEENVREYNTRIQIIEQARNLMHKLGTVFDARFRAGIGNIYSMEELKTSYREAYRALSGSTSSVAHIEDLIKREFVDNYPEYLEKKMLLQIDKGNWSQAKIVIEEFFDWMLQNHYDDRSDIQLKVLELVMRAEREAFLNGGIGSYRFSERRNYLTEVISGEDYGSLRRWFVTKLETVCKMNMDKQEKQSETVVSRAKSYIQEHYSKDLSLDEVSRAVDISPYYFSKLFKEEAGQNFIEYLTEVRISHAKELLMDSSLSIKEICIRSGYSDPNYFSRIFKKQEDVTPSVYRDKVKGME